MHQQSKRFLSEWDSPTNPFAQPRKEITGAWRTLAISVPPRTRGPIAKSLCDYYGHARTGDFYERLWYAGLPLHSQHYCL